MNSEMGRVIEAIEYAHNTIIYEGSPDEQWREKLRRMAQAAVDALVLTEETRTVHSICDMADPGIPEHRFVSPWTPVT
jgi:hypothetical protein